MKSTDKTTRAQVCQKEKKKKKRNQSGRIDARCNDGKVLLISLQRMQSHQ